MAFVSHPFEPIYDKDSRVLILGTMPSVISRKNNFYYSNPSNRFWKLLSALFEAKYPESNLEKKKLLIDNKVAVWDVLSSCDIESSSDSSIKEPVVNDIMSILKETQISKVFANGDKAYKLYKKYVDSDIVPLPSTSPANARFNMENLLSEWKVLKDYLK